MCVVNLKVFSVLFIVYLTIFCFSCQSSRSEIGLSPQWSSSPLMYLHNFHHQSLYCQPDLSQVLGKAILVASRNAVQCHCWALLQHCHGPTGGMRPVVLHIGLGAVSAAGVHWDGQNSVIPVYMLLWHWWGFWGFIGLVLVGVFWCLFLAALSFLSLTWSLALCVQLRIAGYNLGCPPPKEPVLPCAFMSRPLWEEPWPCSFHP